MKKRLLVILICIALLLSACSPRLISEAKAKEAGLAFINHVFDVNETEAVVTDQEQTGTTFLDGNYQVTGKEQPVLIYIVSAGKQQDGQYLYRAQVNAETGVAFAAERSYSFVPKMTADQRVIWDKARGNGGANSFDYESMDVDCTQLARKWIPEKFELKAGILSCDDCGGSFYQNGASATFYVVIRDGSIYQITVAWPQLTVLEITVLNQTRPFEDMP